MFNECTRNAILFLFVIGLVYFYILKPREAFEDSTIANVNYAAAYNQSPDNMPERPTHYDKSTGEMVLDPNFVQQPLDYAWGKPYVDNSGETANADSINYSSVDLRNAPCSKSCCGPQYPTPFKLHNDENVCKNKDKLNSSNLMCNNEWQDVGCMCLTNKQTEFLASRGGNAY
jgi:hypothetical protein